MPPAMTETITATVSEACTSVAAARPPISAAAITSSAQPSWAVGDGRLRGLPRAQPGALLGPAVGAHWPTCGSCGVRRNVTSAGPVLRSAAEQIQPASTCVVRTALPQPIGGSTHTWYWPAGTFAANSRAGFSAPVTTLVSVPSFSTFTWLPETLRPSVLPSVTLTVSLRGGPLVAAALALAVGVVPCAARPASMRGR